MLRSFLDFWRKLDTLGKLILVLFILIGLYQGSTA